MEPIAITHLTQWVPRPSSNLPEPLTNQLVQLPCNLGNTNHQKLIKVLSKNEKKQASKYYPVPPCSTRPPKKNLQLTPGSSDRPAAPVEVGALGPGPQPPAPVAPDCEPGSGDALEMFMDEHHMYIYI